MNFSYERDEEREVVRRMLGRWGRSQDNLDEIENDIDTVQQQLDALLDVHAAPLDGLPRGNGISDKTARTATRYAERKKALEDRIEFLREQKAEEERIYRAIYPAVRELPPMEKRVIRLRYVEQRRMREISQIMHYDQRTIEDAEVRALKRLKPTVFSVIEKNVD